MTSEPSVPSRRVGDPKTLQFLRFLTLQGERLVRLGDIVECLPMVQLKEAESSQNHSFRGLLHFRGRVVPVFEVFPCEQTALDPEWFLIVLDVDGEQRLALIARDIDGIVTRPKTDCETIAVGPDEHKTVVSTDHKVVEVIEPAEFVERGS